MQSLPLFNQNGFADGDRLVGQGFRLQRLEVLNWGTFDQRPWILEFNGKTSLLTGANGSGKSTLVDSILTLLVPSRKRNYNQASSSTGKRERSEKSYVQGVYSRSRQEDSYSHKDKMLRPKGTYSVLLAYFCDLQTQQKVTLAQVFWISQNGLEKFYAIAEQDLSIKPHFTEFANIRDLKRRLKINQVECFGEFVKYSKRFRKLLGLQSEKALDLFNQTVSIKEIGGLNEFVRKHMLEASDVRKKIEELQENYENLSVSHSEIAKAQKQLEHLIPLGEDAEKWKQIKKDITNHKNSLDIAPAYFSLEKNNLLIEELKKTEQSLTKIKEREVEINTNLKNLRQQEKDLDLSILQDSIGQQLEKNQREIQYQKERLKERKKKADRYNSVAEKLNLPQYENRDIFYEAREQCELFQNEIEVKIKDIIEKLDEQKHKRSNLQQQCEPLESELDSLRKRKSQIPKRNLEIRDRIARELDLQEADLPFVGELLQVRSEYQEWRGAIERLLRGFGLCVLVLEQHYHEVSRYVDRTRLGGRFVYYSIKSIAVNPMQRSLDSQRVPFRLEIKQERAEFYPWLRDRLSKQFNYVCCETIEKFQHETYAITKAGSLKQGNRHEKDDRKKISDRSQYILGWNNVDKIKALEEEFSILQKQLNVVRKEIVNLDQKSKNHEKQKSDLQKFMAFENFTEIDWYSVQLEIQNLEEQKAKLEASAKHLEQLRIQLEEVQTKILNLNRERDGILGEIRHLKDRQKTNIARKGKCEEKLKEISLEAIEKFAIAMNSTLRRYNLDLETIDESERQFCDRLREKIDTQKGKRNSVQSSILSRILNFRNAFTEVVLELDSGLEALDEYLELKDKIEQEDLPRHQKRFKELLNEKIIEAIAFFNRSLRTQKEDIEHSINELNLSLQKIDYTDSTYIQLQYKDSIDRDIRDFQGDLIKCLGNFSHQSAEDNEIRFQNIKKLLISRFKTEERWTKKVTDVRNWLDFSVSEKYRTDDVEKEHHTDSSGKSGGQKVKLAYTILASAIAYQFGLYQENTQAKSFRFVVIDEAFSKSDDNNSRYAMELFKNLGLQLLVITPLDKINVIESYLSSIHFVANTSEGNYSSLTSMTVEEYRDKRQLHLNKKS
jgi:uncharacterized protein YPO0396